MYIRLCVNDGIIDGGKVSDICELFGEKLFDSFKQRKTYDEYYYQYPIDIIVTTEHIQKLMDLNYKIIFYSDIMEIK